MSLKPLHQLPLAAVLVALVVWNVAGWREGNALEREIDRLRKRLESTKAVATQRSVRVISRPEMRWQEPSLPERAISGGKAVKEMSATEILAALAGIDLLGLDPGGREQLEEKLAGALVKRDPALALATFADRIHHDSDGVAWLLPGALGGWAKTDPAGAAAWFDREIAAGRFEGKSLDGQSQARVEFEGALAAVLFATDAPAAGLRLAALPEDQRGMVLGEIGFSELSPAARLAFVDCARNQVPEDRRGESFMQLASALVSEGGYGKVTAFLDEIQATPGEREVAAQQAAGTALEEISNDRVVTRQDLENMRKWLGTQSPGGVDRVVGTALGHAVDDDGPFHFAEAARLVLEYRNDAMLEAFLESAAAASNPELALPLAEKIGDEEIRGKILARLKENP